MVELEEVLSGDGAERRVDNHMLVVYLGQLNSEVQDLGARLSAHMTIEEDHQAKVKELIELLIAFKGVLRAFKWIASVAGGVAIIWGAIKGLSK